MNKREWYEKHYTKYEKIINNGNRTVSKRKQLMGTLVSWLENYK